MATPQQRTEAREAAVRWLLESRAPDGWWRDFALAAGAADEWVTAYAGSALGAAGVIDAACEAWHQLESALRPDGGWAYNGWTPADADSTAWGLRLAGYARAACSTRAYDASAFLARCEHRGGGIATYPDDASIRRFTRHDEGISYVGWCAPHACVTAAAIPVLKHPARARAFLRDCQRPDGSWMAYWWMEPAYATALAVAALDAREDATPIRRAVAWARVRAVHVLDDPFVLALCLAILRSHPDGARDAGHVEQRLLAAQQSDGSWEGSASLRVPDPWDLRPDERASWVAGGRIEGAVVLDARGVFTTATALYALAGA